MRTYFTRSRRLVVATAIVTAVAAGIGISPAAAHTVARSSAPFAFCDPLAAQGAEQFSGVYSLVATSSIARGSELREPVTSETAPEVPANARGKGGPGFRATVPVWFHVVHDGARANLTQKQIDAQIAVMNAGYSGREGGYDTGFRFKLVGVTRTDNAEWLSHGFGDKAERDMKSALRRGGWDTLNIYSTEASAYLGWAYFAGLPESRQYLDGLVVDWESMPGTSTEYAGQYDLGKTATHEAGHWFNLYHVFQGGCNNWGDYVADTPPQVIATFGCPAGQDSCREPGVDSIHNYMDYSFDSCYTQFTKGQAERMPVLGPGGSTRGANPHVRHA